MVIDEKNEAGGYYDKYFLRDNRSDIYMKENRFLIKGGYYMEVGLEFCSWLCCQKYKQ